MFFDELQIVYHTHPVARSVSIVNGSQSLTWKAFALVTKYYYKLQEYTDFSKIEDDISWRQLAEIRKHLLSVAWIPLEKVIEAVYRNLSFPQSDQARAFFTERRL